MKRIVVGMAAALGLLGLPGALEGQGYVGPQDLPYGAVRALKQMGDRLEAAGKERLDLLGVLTRAGQSAVGVRILWEFPGKVRLEKQLGAEPDPSKDELLVYGRGGEPAQEAGDGGLGG